MLGCGSVYGTYFPPTTIRLPDCPYTTDTFGFYRIRANVRVAGAARRGAREPLLVALRAGGFAAILVVASATAGVASLYAVFSWLYLVGANTDATAISSVDIPLLLVGYGFGASFVALFAQLGGGTCCAFPKYPGTLFGPITTTVYSYTSRKTDTFRSRKQASSPKPRMSAPI